MSTETQKPTKITTKLVRLSYANLFTPKGVKGGKEKYSASILIRKDDDETLSRVKNAIKAAEAEGVAGKWKGAKPKKYKDEPLRDGDEDYPGDEAYAGCYYVNAKNDKKPVIVGMEKDAKDAFKEITNEADVYSGMYARCNITAYAFNADGSKGIAWSLNSVQKVKDGEPLGGGRTDPDEDFEEELDDEEMYN